MSGIGTCDLCNGQISQGEGYVFYSATVPPFSKTGEETGGMHLCEACTEEYINDQQFQKPMKMPSLTAEDFASNMSKAIEWMKKANALGIVALCKAHGLTPVQAKNKAREFAILIWKDKQQAIRESTAFWTSKRSRNWETPETKPWWKFGEHKVLRSKILHSYSMANNQMHSASKKRRSFLTLIFAAGDGKCSPDRRRSGERGSR